MTPKHPHSETGPRERAWIDVRYGALLDNLEQIRAANPPDTQLIPMVKADGYGLGAFPATAALHSANPLGWGVATLAEAEALRDHGLSEPIMIFSPIPPDSLPRAVAARAIPAISDPRSLAVLRNLALHASNPITFQLELDTGMGRAGFALDPMPASIWRSALRDAIRAGLRIFGVFTHLHSAEAADTSTARAQIRDFDSVVETLQRDGILPDDTLIHCANSAAAMRSDLRSRTANAVRPGIHLYGAVAGPAVPAPTPVATLRARVLLVRNAAPGTTLGYGATYRASSEERWAVIGIGYGDGLPRALGNRGFALFQGRRLRIIGRISMDTTVVRMDDCDLVPGDVVTFFGRDGDTELPLEKVAGLAGTIPYEILTGLSPRLPRVPAK